MSEIYRMLHVYNSLLADRMQALTAPLNSRLGITECIYTYMANDGHFFSISNQPEPAEFYFSEHYYKSTLLIRHPDNYLDGAILPFAIPNETNEPLMVDRFGYASESLLALFRKDSKGVHKFLFNRKNSNSSIINFYLKNLPLFESYCTHFIEQWQAEAHKAERYTIDIGALIGKAFYHIAPLETFGGCPKSIKEKFLKEIRALPRDFSPPEFALSQQEEACLRWMSQGYTLKETAEEMNLSPRTVESYFNNIKNKMHCYTKSDALQMKNYLELIGN